MDARFNAFHEGAKNSVEFSILAGPSKTKMGIYEDVWRKFILIRFLVSRSRYDRWKRFWVRSRA